MKPTFPCSFRYRGPGYEGFVAIDSLSNGMAFGGCRISPDVNEATVRRLAQAMTRKLRAHGLPTGGAKAGIRLIPHEADSVEALRGFALAAQSQLRARVVIGKDMGATDEMLDRIYAALGISQLDVPRVRRTDTLLPSRIRDLRGYLPHMTGRGVARATQAFLDFDLDGKSVAIQGAGAVGVGTALRLNRAGARVVAISDIEHALVDMRGLDLGTLEDFIGGKRIHPEKAPAGVEVRPRDDLFAVKADVLVLAASSNCVTRDDAEAIHSRVVVEGANFPLTSQAAESLARRGIPVVPDVIANSSSAALVCTQMADDNRRDPDELWDQIDTTIGEATQRLRDRALRRGTTLRAQLDSLESEERTNS